MRLTIKLGPLESWTEVDIHASDPRAEFMKALDGLREEFVSRYDQWREGELGPFRPGAVIEEKDVLPSLASLALRVVRIEERIEDLEAWREAVREDDRVVDKTVVLLRDRVDALEARASRPSLHEATIGKAPPALEALEKQLATIAKLHERLAELEADRG